MTEESLNAKLSNVTVTPVNLRKTLYHGGFIESPESCANGLVIPPKKAST